MRSISLDLRLTVKILNKIKGSPSLSNRYFNINEEFPFQILLNNKF